MLETTIELLFSTKGLASYTSEQDKVAVQKILDSLPLMDTEFLDTLKNIQRADQKFHVTHVFAKVGEELRERLHLDQYIPGKDHKKDEIALAYAVTSVYAAIFMESCFTEILPFFKHRETRVPSPARAYLKRKDKHDFASHACALVADARKSPAERTFFLECSRFHANKSILLHQYHLGKGSAFTQLYLRRAQANYGLALMNNPAEWKFQAVAADILLALEKDAQVGEARWRTSTFLSKGACFLANVALCFDQKSHIKYSTAQGMRVSYSAKEIFYQDALDYLAQAKIALTKERTALTGESVQNSSKLFDYQIPDFNSCPNIGKLPVIF